jgi:hypothetical protein
MSITDRETTIYDLDLPAQLRDVLARANSALTSESRAAYAEVAKAISLALIAKSLSERDRSRGPGNV